VRLIIQTAKSQEIYETKDLVILPASEGDMGILPGHAPMVVKLKRGDIKINGKYYLISPGYAKVGPQETIVYSVYIPKL